MRLLLLLIAARAARLRRDRLLVEYQRERVPYRALADACGEANTAALVLCEEARRVRALRSIGKKPDQWEAA